MHTFNTLDTLNTFNSISFGFIIIASLTNLFGPVKIVRSLPYLSDTCKCFYELWHQILHKIWRKREEMKDKKKHHAQMNQQISVQYWLSLLWKWTGSMHVQVGQIVLIAGSQPNKC